MTHRTYVNLADICSISIGRTPLRANLDYWGAGYPWLSIADMNQGKYFHVTKETITAKAVSDCNCRIVEPGTLLFSFKLSIGKIGFAAVPLYTNEAIAALAVTRPDLVRKEYLYWVLQSTDVSLSVDKAVMGQTLNKRKLECLRVYLPTLEEQDKIIEQLDGIQSLIEKRKAALNRLHTVMSSMFLDMFGDPESNPHGFPVLRVSDFVSELQGGKNVNPADESEDGIRYRILKVSAVTSGVFNASKTKPLPADFDPPEDYFVRPGDLLFSRANTEQLVGATALVSSCPDNLILPDKIWRFVWKDESKIEPSFVRALFQTPSVRKMLSTLATGTSGSMKNISKAKLMKMEVPMPPKELQSKFAVLDHELKKLELSMIASEQQLDQLFHALKHQAFFSAQKGGTAETLTHV